MNSLRGNGWKEPRHRPKIGLGPNHQVDPYAQAKQRDNTVRYYPRGFWPALNNNSDAFQYPYYHPPFPTTNSSPYYRQYSSAPSHYGEYSIDTMLRAPLSNSYEYRGYESFTPSEPRPLFENVVPSKRIRPSSSFFGLANSHTSYVPSKKRKAETVKTSRPNFSKVENDKTEKKSEPQKDASFLRQPTNNAEELFEKCNTLGEARMKQFRYKVYRVLNRVGLDFVTLTEQQGTYAKRGALNVKVVLKNFFPQYFFGESSGTEHERACYDATVNLSLKLNKIGFMPCDTIAMFFNRILYNSYHFERTKCEIQLLIDEVNKRDFSVSFKEGKEESETQMEMLQECIRIAGVAAEKLRSESNNKIDCTVEKKAF